MDRTSIIYISAEVVVGVASALGNSIVLVAIVRTRRLHTATNVFVGNLALADIAVGLLVAPLAALSFKGLPRNFYGCVMVNSLILLFTNVSIFMLLAVALERFLAIKEPFTYQRLMTVNRAIKINIAVWLLGSFFGLVPLYGWNSGKKHIDYCRFTDVITYEYMVYFQFFGLVLLPLSLMLAIYIYILIIVRRHTRQTHALHRQVLHNVSNSDARQGSSKALSNHKFNKDVRAAKMFALLILLFAMFWLPINIFNCISLFCPHECTFTYESLLVAIVMSHANSSFNPLVYAASNSRIKGAIKVMFGIKTSVEETSTDINNEGRTTNGVTAQRTAMKEAVEIAENQNASRVSAPYYSSIETCSPHTDSPQNGHTETTRETELLQRTSHRRTSLPNFAFYSTNPLIDKVFAHRSPSYPSKSRQRPSSAKQSHSPISPDTQIQENPRLVKLFCVSSQTMERPLELSPLPMSRLGENDNPVYQQESPNQNTFLQRDDSPQFVPELRNSMRRNAIHTSAIYKVNYNDDEKGTHFDLNDGHVDLEERRQPVTQVEENITYTGASQHCFQLVEVTSPPLIENLQPGELTQFNNVFRTSEVPLSRVDIDLTSEDTASSIRSRSKLKSPSLFSELEESNMVHSKWADHTKL